jgi:long-chain acyl-CoA synthetase
MWAARRAGLYYTTLSTHWKVDEVGYVLRDCGARALFVIGATAADAALPARLEGADFLYSSGTTGRPKGIPTPKANCS